LAQGQTPKPSAPPAASAAPAQIDAPVIAVIDVNEVVNRSKAGQAIQPQFEKLKKSYEDALNRDRNALTEEAKQLEGQRAVLAPEAFAQRVNAVRQKEIALNQQIVDRKRVLDTTLNNALSQIRNVLFQVSQDIARERGVNIVLPKEAIVIVARNLEITDDVLKRVDEKLPSVALKVAQPSSTQPAAPAQRQQPAPRQQQQQKK
jgi:Skp family chaperone for outer membrane proteins